MAVLVSFCQLTQTRVTWKEGTSTEEVPPSSWPLRISGVSGASIWPFLACWFRWAGPAHLGWGHPGQLVLGGVLKGAEWEQASRQLSFMVPALTSHCGSCGIFLPELVWLEFYHSNREANWTLTRRLGTGIMWLRLPRSPTQLSGALTLLPFESPVIIPRSQSSKRSPCFSPLVLGNIQGFRLNFFLMF